MFQAFVSFIKISSQKHVIMKNFDTKKMTNDSCYIFQGYLHDKILK